MRIGISLDTDESKEFYSKHREAITQGIELFFETIGIEAGVTFADIVPTRFGDTTIKNRTVEKVKDAGDDLIESIEDSFNV